MRIERCPRVYEPDDDSYLLMGIDEIRGNILEIGCGTGIVGLSYAISGSRVTMVDISEDAVKCSRHNASINGISVGIVRTSLFKGIKGRFDYCIFNPPYLSEDPPNDLSWTGGIRGNEVTEEFLREFNRFSRRAFYIESSLSPVDKSAFSGLEFAVVRKIDYESEELRLVRVTGYAFDR